MKKLLLLIIILFANKAKSQSDEIMLRDFINSSDFFWVTKYSGIVGNWKPDISQSFVAYESVNGKKVPILTVALISEGEGYRGKYIAQVQAVKLKSTYKQLPRNAAYLMLFRDFSDFDVVKQSGTIRIFDLNYDEWLVLESTIESGSVRTVETHDMPIDIIGRYDFGNLGKAGPDHHFCDKNNNGDVSWGECFSCLMGTCQRNWTCQLICNIINLKSGACLVSMALACVWIALQY